MEEEEDELYGLERIYAGRGGQVDQVAVDMELHAVDIRIRDGKTREGGMNIGKW